MNIDEFEIKLEEACQTAISNGYQIAPQGKSELCCCPLGALIKTAWETAGYKSQYILKEAPNYPSSFGAWVCLKEYLSEGDALVFIAGFDDSSYNLNRYYKNDYYKLGKKLRDKYVG